MPKASFPIKGQLWETSYLGDYWGDIIQGFSINNILDRAKIRASLPLTPHTTNQDLSFSNYFLFAPTGFAFFDNKFWAVANKVYRTNFIYQNFAVDTYVNSPTDLNDADIIVFNNKLIVSRPTDLAKREPGNGDWFPNWWTAPTGSGGLGQTALNNSVHPLAVLGKHLFIGDKNLLHSVDSGDVVYKNRLIFPHNATIQWIKTTPTRIFLGVSYTDGRFEVVEYIPLLEDYREWFSDEGKMVGFIWDNNLFVVSEEGNLHFWNGNGFTFFAKFPTKLRGYADAGVLTLPHRNGIAVVSGFPHFLMGGQDFRKHFAGLYICDPIQKNIYHHRSIVFNYNSLLSFGVLGVSGLSAVGALFYEKNNFVLLAGAQIYKTNLDEQIGIYSSLDYFGRQKTVRGHFTLPKIKSGAIDNIWMGVLVKYKLFSANDKIIVKYQTDENENLYPHAGFGGSWVSNNQIYSNYVGGSNGWSVGDELFIIAGDGEGLFTQITNINTTTKRITIEDNVSGASGDIMFRVINFRKVGEITDTSKNEQFLNFPTNPLINHWIKVKLELRGDAEVENVEVYYKPNERNL